MGAFLSALSGVGQGAGQYGEQVRGLLEQRRGDFANLIAKAAEQESDPQTRAAMLQHSADLLSGKPIGNIAQKFSQTLDKRHADNQALAQTIGQPPQAPQPQPGTAPGVTPGNAVPPDNGMYVGGIQNGKAPAPTPAPAAQPATSPVQPGAQAIPPVGAPSPVAIAASAPPMSESLGMPAGMQIPGLPTPQNPQEIVRRAMSNPLWQAPANRPILLQGAQQELSHQEALRQALETKQATIAYAQNAIQHMKADGSWDKLPDFYRAELQMAASGVNAPSFPAGMVLPHLISAGTMGSQAPPGTKIFGTEDLVKPNERYRVMNIPAYGNIWQPEQAQTAITTTPTGQPQITNKQSGESIAPVEGAVNPAFVPNEGVRLVQQPDGSIKLVPVETGKKIVGGARTPIAPVGGQSTPASAPPVTARQGPAGVRGPGVTVGGRNLPPQQILQFKNSIEVGAHQLWGDPDNPALRPLASYSNLADDPGARDRISKALKLVLESGGSEGASHIGTSVGPVSFSPGGIGEWITNEFGVPQALAQQRAQIVRGAMDQLKPEELQYFNSLMNAIPTITGLRRLTGGAAFKWSQDALERELPMVGLAGTTSAGAFRQKMVALGDEVLTGAKNLARTNPEAVDPRLMQLIRSGGAASPIAPVQGREAQGGYQIGHKYGDLTYQGGNPNDRNSWK